ncbi:hypothetical protein [Streptomyces sp. URMC 129]|uniref:hypothetical protein n=1 Tax=Streptomyces sp. URMC 129 TaxID=3423407 RepID=UPI003F1AA68F
MTTEYPCDCDGTTTLRISPDPDGYVRVELWVNGRFDGEVFLAPASAREAARALTLTSLEAEADEPDGRAPKRPAPTPPPPEAAQPELEIPAGFYRRALAIHVARQFLAGMGVGAGLGDVLRLARFLDAG